MTEKQAGGGFWDFGKLSISCHSWQLAGSLFYNDSLNYASVYIFICVCFISIKTAHKFTSTK